MKLFTRTAILIAAFVGLLFAGITGASAADKGLSHYAKDPAATQITKYKPIKVAQNWRKRGWRKKGWRKRGWRRGRRNGAIVGGVLAAGVAAIILSDAIRSGRRNYYYDDNYYAYPYPGRRQCRKWARRCDRGVRRACRVWNRRCR